MFQRLITPELILRHPNKKGFKVGRPGPRMLHGWVYTIDLGRYHIRVTDPLDIRNFVAVHTKYTSDKVRYGLPEYFPQSSRELEVATLEGRKEDCDGLAMLAVAILHTLGVPGARLALGYYGKDPEGPQKKGANHAYVILAKDRPLLIETTGDVLIERLPLLDDHPEYHTLMTSDGENDWLHGYWAEIYQ